MEIRAEKFKVSYDNLFSLDFPSLSLSGNIIAVLGHNGAGKSTLIKSILDLLPVQSGKLEIFRENNGKFNPQGDMAFCPESGAIFADITVESYLELWGRIKGYDSKTYKIKSEPYIEYFELTRLLKKRGCELSKGQKRRVQTVVGFLTDPALFLFDEPFDGLDVQKTQELSDAIKNHAGRMSFIISSHRMDVIERLADAFIVLKEGKIYSQGNIEKICKDLAPNIEALKLPERKLHVPSLVDAMNFHLKFNRAG